MLRTHLVESFLIHAPDLQGALELFAVEPAGLVTKEESTHGQDIGVSMHTREGRVGGGGASLPVDDAKGAAESGHAVRAARLHVLLQLRQAAFEGPYTRHDDRGYERELCVCVGWAGAGLCEAVVSALSESRGRCLVHCLCVLVCSASRVRV